MALGVSVQLGSRSDSSRWMVETKSWSNASSHDKSLRGRTSFTSTLSAQHGVQSRPSLPEIALMNIRIMVPNLLSCLDALPFTFIFTSLSFLFFFCSTAPPHPFAHDRQIPHARALPRHIRITTVIGKAPQRMHSRHLGLARPRTLLRIRDASELCKQSLHDPPVVPLKPVLAIRPTFRS